MLKLLCLLGHNWRTARAHGGNLYEECQRCSERRARTFAGYQEPEAPDYLWLLTGQWSDGWKLRSY